MNVKVLCVRVLFVIGLGFALGGLAPQAAAGPSASVPSSIPNGRSIFQKGKDLHGVQIIAQKPPLFPSCASCHRTNGAGGMHLPGGAVSADLRHAALVTHQKHPYTITLLERAISTGIDNAGKPLDPVMPRWRLSKQDLQDVSFYVLTQLK